MPFFTTNYDTAVEYAAGALELRVYDSFRSDTSGGRLWHWGVLGDYRDDPEKTSIVLVKLHGSVDWGSRRVTGTEAYLRKIPPDMRRDPGGYTHTLLYPTLGSKQVRREPYRTSYDCLHQSLLRANLLIAIGTSFRDPELNEELRRALEENSGLHLVAISPNADYLDVAKAIQAEGSGGRIGTLRGKFGDPALAPPNQLLMSYLRDLARLAFGVQKTVTSLKFGANNDFPIRG